MSLESYLLAKIIISGVAFAVALVVFIWKITHI